MCSCGAFASAWSWGVHVGVGPGVVVGAGVCAMAGVAMAAALRMDVTPMRRDLRIWGSPVWLVVLGEESFEARRVLAHQ